MYMGVDAVGPWDTEASSLDFEHLGYRCAGRADLACTAG